MTTILSLSIIFLIFEIRNFINPKKYDIEIEGIKSNIKKGVMNLSDRPLMTFHFLYFIWSIIGLFSHYWPIFTTLFILGLISSNINKGVVEDSERVRGRRIDALFTAILLILLNYFIYF